MTTPLEPELFDLDEDVLWVMHSAEGPVPLAGARAIEDFLRRETKPWKLRWQADFQGIPWRTRQEAALLLGGSASDVTLTATTSSGLTVVAQCYPWRPGDRVVVPAGEFPSNYWTWKALEGRGVGVTEVPLWDGHRTGREAALSEPPAAGVDPEARLLAALGPSSQVLAVSWVRFQDGLVLDLQRLAAGCRERGVALVVDGIQGAGTLPIDLDGLSAFAAGGHKGLLAPQGLGILWTDPAFRQRLLPAGSWLSVEDATDFSRPPTDFDRAWLDDGSRFEQGVPNLIGCVALSASLRLLNRAAAAAIAEHAGKLRARLFAGLEDSPEWRAEAGRLAALDDAGRLGSIVALRPAGGPDAAGRFVKQGMAQGIYASAREGYLRVAFHGWHTENDADRLLEWLT